MTITIPECPEEPAAIETEMTADDADEDEDEEGRGRGRSRDLLTKGRESAGSDDRSRSASLDRTGAGDKGEAKPSKHSLSVPPVKSARGPEPPASAAKSGARFGSRSLSPPAANARGRANWKGGEDEELFKLEVLQQHVPTEDNLWMIREMQILKSFTRIFPPMPKPGKEDKVEGVDGPTKAASGTIDNNEGGSDNGDESDNDNDEDGEEGDGGEAGTAKSASAAANGATAPEKKKLATMNDILIEAFLQDRRQTLRLRAPLANHVREKDANSLPALDNGKAAWGSTKASTKSSAVTYGWKPPQKPDPEKKKSGDKPILSQTEVANRLYKGLSSSSPQNTANNVLSAGASFTEPSLGDSVGLLEGGGSVDGLNSFGSVYSSAPQNPGGIAFYGGQSVAAAYPSATAAGAGYNSITYMGAPTHQQRPHQARAYVKPSPPQPRPGSLWGNTGNYVLDTSPGTSYIPAQFRSHAISDGPHGARQAPQPAPAPAPLRQQVTAHLS